MGFYINPAGKTKEQWLEENAKPIKDRINKKIFEEKSTDEIPLCLVDNGVFTALGICHSLDELEIFANPNDKRIKFWYMAKKKDVMDACSIDEKMMD